jgi:hypothetical protein
MAATTAVIAGTAGAVQHHQQQKYAAQDQQQYDAQQYEAQAAAQGCGSAGRGTEADPMAEIQKLAQLHAAGVLTDEEFAAAKPKLSASDRPRPSQAANRPKELGAAPGLLTLGQPPPRPSYTRPMPERRP